MRSLLFIFGLFYCFGLWAQEGRLAAFSVNELDRSNVQINWTMKAGVSCQNPEVQRSTDSLNFNSIYRYPGVCGGGDEQESYSWIDSRPIRSNKSYYRLKIDEGEFSTIVSVEAAMDFSQDPIRVYPIPTSDLLNITYLEELGKLEEIRLYNSQGIEVRIDLASTLEDQPLGINVFSLPTGVYFLWLEFSDAEARKVKFVKTKL